MLSVLPRQLHDKHSVFPTNNGWRSECDKCEEDVDRRSKQETGETKQEAKSYPKSNSTRVVSRDHSHHPAEWSELVRSNTNEVHKVLFADYFFIELRLLRGVPKDWVKGKRPGERGGGGAER